MADVMYDIDFCLLAPRLDCVGLACAVGWRVAPAAILALDTRPLFMTSRDLGATWSAVQPLPVHPAAPGAVGEIDIVCLQTQGRCALALQLAPSPLGTVVTGTLPGCSFPAIAPSPTQARTLLAGPPTSQAIYRPRTRTATRAPSKELREAELRAFAL
jgi:hypothetical protein